MRVLYTSAALAIAAGLAGTWWAVGELRTGATELPQHWWSSAPLVLVTLGLILALVARVAPRLAKLTQ
jgi:hypothetical protein